MAIILACVRMTWMRLGPWTAVPIVASIGGVAAGAIRFLLSNSVFGSPWPEDWPRELGIEVVGVALLAVALALLRGPNAGLADAASAKPGSRGSGVLAGTAGLLLLVLGHLTAGFLVSGWTMEDSRRLATTAALLAAVGSAALIAAARGRSHPLQ